MKDFNLIADDLRILAAKIDNNEIDEAQLVTHLSMITENIVNEISDEEALKVNIH